MPEKPTNVQEKDSSKRRGAIGMKRIQRATDKEDIIQLLTADGTGIFREIWRLLLFAAVLGQKNGRREKLSAVETGRGIDQSSFGNNPAWPGVLYLLGLIETDATEVLCASEEAEDERIAVFEEFANGGLAILKGEFAARNCNLDTFLIFIETQIASTSAKPANLKISI